jgi:hypothetical protein
MAEQLTIMTENRGLLKPLVTSALDHEKKILAMGIMRTRTRIATFERTYAMTSAEFEQRLHTLDLVETPDFTDWRMELETLRLLESQYQALDEAHLD